MKTSQLVEAGWLRSVMGVAVGGLLLSCGPPGPRGEAESARPLSIRRSPDVVWETPLGPGGGRVPELPDFPEDPPSPGGMSLVRGAIFPENGREILFIGTYEEGDPVLTPDDLMDAFVVSLRGLESGEAPGVSIDPTSDQILNDLDENDLMTVRYMGGTEGSRVGFIAFEADRVMKNLSSGKDNITKQPVSSRVPGYSNRLDMADDTNMRPSWTRFWIEQDSTEVQVSRDGRAFMVEPRMLVRVRPSVVRGDSLVDARDTVASPSARRFAQHMTDHYIRDRPDEIDFATDFPVYRELLAHAALVNLAEAVRPGGGLEQARVDLDMKYFLEDYQPRLVSTAETTPATIAKKTVPTQTGTVTHQITGGVDETPKNDYRTNNRTATTLAGHVRHAIAQAPRQRHWRVGPYEVVSKIMSSPVLSVWQTDLPVGHLEVVRVLGGEGGGPLVGSSWSIRVPRVEMATETADFSDIGTMPRFARVVGYDGQAQMLGDVGNVQIPGQPLAAAHMARGVRSGDRQLVQYSNAWFYFDSEVQFVSTNGGPITWDIPAGSYVVRFSAEPGHRVEQVMTSDGLIDYDFTGSRLTRLSDPEGQFIDFVYAGPDLVSLSGSDGSRVDYRVATDGFLSAVVDADGNSITYTRLPGTQSVAGMRASSPIGERRSDRRGSFDISLTQDWLESTEVSERESTPEQVFSGVRRAAAGSSENFEVQIAGRSVGGGRIIAEYLEGVRTRGQGDADPTALLGLFRDNESVIGRGRIVLVGDHDVVVPLSTALRTLEVEVLVASDSDLAVENLSRRTATGYGLSVVGFSQPVPERLAGLPRGSEDGHVLVVVGNTSRQLEDYLTEVRVDGRAVVLLTSGAEEFGLAGMLLNRGATEVLSFVGSLDVGILPALVERLTTRLDGARLRPGDLGRLLEEAVGDMNLVFWDRIGLP